MIGWGIRERKVLAFVFALIAAVSAISLSLDRARLAAAASSVPVTIQVSTHSFVLNAGSVTVTGQVGDTGQQGINISVEDSSDGGPWQYVAGSTFLARSGSVTVSPIIDRNTLFRVHVTSINNPSFNAYSGTVQVYVFPSAYLSLAPLSARALEVNYQALVHPVSHAPRRRLFIYTRHPGQHRFHLVGSRWLRFTAQSEPQYILHYRLRNRGAVTVLVCTRQPLLPDMGVPFHDPGCGRRSGRLP